MTDLADVEIVFRNPPGRWLSRLFIGLAILLAAVWLSVATDACGSGAGESCNVGLVALVVLFPAPLYLPFFLMAWAAARARVTLTDTGIGVRGMIRNRTFPWERVSQVQEHETSYSTGGIPTGTDRYVRICVDGKRMVTLPVPQAGRVRGVDEYHSAVGLIHRAWRTHRQERAPGR